jgi:transposase
MKLVVDRHGTPFGVVAAPADMHEVQLAWPALEAIPADVFVPWDVPVLADRAYDSDLLCEDLAAGCIGCWRPTAATNDGRRMRRYRRRYAVARTFGWLHSYRRVVVRHEWYSFTHAGFVDLACALVALRRL